MTGWFEGALACTSADGGPRESAEAHDPSDEVSKLRSRANRYRALAMSLFDPRVIATVRSCARELEAEANRIEAKTSRKARWILYRGRDSQ